MAPQPTSTTVLIITTLVLNTLPAPEPRLTENPVGMCGGDELGSGARYASFRHLRLSFPPAGRSGVVVKANTTTGSSVLLVLVVVSLPGEGNQSARHPASYYTDTNHTIPWSSLMLEPVIIGGGAPRVGDDTGVFIEETGLHSSSWREVFPPSRSSRKRYRKRYYKLPRESVVVRPRKLLGTDGSSTKRNLQLPRRRRQVRMAGVAVGLALFGLLCALAAVFVLWRMRRNKLADEKKLIRQQIELCPSGPRRYGRNELAAATGGFAEEGKIGRGGFGPVYRGFLLDDQERRQVAVKVMSSQQGSQQGRREFQAEVKVMTRLRHRNIVHLLGWCDDGPAGGLMLVYELVPDGSLDKHLYDPQRLLSWSDRYRVALSVGSAILYLHTECEQCVLHGDIKPANILLDRSRNAKLGDFGLARLVDHGTDSSSYTTQVVAGTPGYMDPELVSTQRPCPESDVFSFGVVLLEIACGRRPTTATAQSDGSTPMLLLNWVRGLHRANSILAAADRRLDGEFDGNQMRRVLVVGLWCAHHDLSQRPSIVQAMDVLRRQDLDLPLHVDLGMQGPEVARSLEEIAYGDFSEAEDSASGNPATDTAYHTSTDSSCLP